MAWVAQRTWVTAETITASMFNVMVRDDQRFLYSPPHARAGSDEGETQNSTETIASTDLSILEVDFSVTTEDTDNMREITSADYPASIPAATPSSRFMKVNTAGKYLLASSIAFQVHADMTVFGISIGRASDALSIARKTRHVTAAPTVDEIVGASSIWDCVVGDLFYVTALWRQGAGGQTSADLSGATLAYPYLSAQWMGN